MTKDYAIALNRFNLNWNEFLFLTPLEFFLALKDQEQLDVSKMMIQCEAIRTSTWYLLNVQVKKKINNPKKLFKFPWDNDTQKEPQTLEEMKNVMRAIVGYSKSNKNKK